MTMADCVILNVLATTLDNPQVTREQIDVISLKMRSIASSNLKAFLPEVG